jgi:hypothetical protein
MQKSMVFFILNWLSSGLYQAANIRWKVIPNLSWNPIDAETSTAWAKFIDRFVPTLVLLVLWAIFTIFHTFDIFKTLICKLIYSDIKACFGICSGHCKS